MVMESANTGVEVPCEWDGGVVVLDIMLVSSDVPERQEKGWFRSTSHNSGCVHGRGRCLDRERNTFIFRK